MARKPVGIAWAADSLTVVCDDGAVYWTTAIEQGWKEGAPIPGSDCARSRAKGPVAAPPSGPTTRRIRAADEV